MAGMGLQTIYYKDFPYMLIPPNHSWIPDLAILAFISGTMLLLAGAFIIFNKKTKPIALVLGTMLLLIFCFYHVPYQFMRTSNYMQLGAWDNAEKELALSSGAFIIAANAEDFRNWFPKKLMPFGAILFSITIISFGIDHFLYAVDVADYIPLWISNRLFWAYFAGTALFGSGIAIFLKIKPRIFATLLGTMIFIWFIILHIPNAITSPFAAKGSEVTSAFLALAYSGIAFVIAGAGEKAREGKSLLPENLKK